MAKIKQASGDEMVMRILRLIEGELAEVPEPQNVVRQVIWKLDSWLDQRGVSRLAPEPTPTSLDRATIERLRKEADQFARDGRRQQEKQQQEALTRAAEVERERRQDEQKRPKTRLPSPMIPDKGRQ